MASNEDIKITLVADTSDVVDGFKDVEKGSDKMAKNVTKDGKEIKKSFDDVTKSTKNIQSAFKKIDIKSFTSSLSNMKKQVSSIATNIKKQLKDALNVKGNIDAKVNMTTDASSGASGSASSMASSMMTGGAMGSQIAKQLAQMQPTMEKVKSSFKELPQQLQTDIGNAIEGLKSAIQTSFNMENVLKDVGIKVDMSDYIDLDNLEQTFDNLMRDWEGKIKYFEEQLEILPKNIEQAQQKLKENPNQQEGISRYIDTLQDKLKLIQDNIGKYKNELNSISTVKFSLGLDEELAKLDKLFEIYEAKPLKINAQPIIDEIERIREQMKELGMDTSFMDGMFDEWNYICQNGTKATAQLGSAMRNVRTDMGTLQQGTQQLINAQTLEIKKQRELSAVSQDSSKAYQTLQKGLIQAKYGFKQFGNDLKSLFSSMKKNSKVLDETGKKAKKLGNDTKKASKQVKSATAGIAASFKSLLTSILPFMTLMGAFNLLKTSTTSAMDAIETTNMYMAVFGDRASDMDTFIKDVNKSMGLGIGQTKQFTAIIGQMGKAMGMSTEEAMSMAQSMATMAGDISSFYNTDITQVQEDLRSALSGSNEVLTKYGIVLREDTIKQYAYANGIARVGQELNASQRAAALTAMVYKQLGQANGDMAKTMDTPAGRARRLAVAFDQLKVALGNVVLPIWNAVMPGLIALANALTAVFNKIASVINGILSLFGMELKTGGGGGIVQDAQSIGTSLEDGLDSASGGADNVADSLADGAKSAKEIAKGLMGIDELNVLSSPEDSSGGSGSGGSGGGAGGGTGTDFGDLGFNVGESENNANDLASKIPEWMERLAKIFKNSFDKSFDYNMFEDFINNCKRVGQSLIDIFGNEELQIATNALNTTLVAELGSLVGTVGTLAVSIGNAIVGGIADSLEENKDYITGKLIDITNIEREASVIRQRLYEALSDIFSTLGGEEAQGIIENIFTTLTVGFLEGQELFSKMGRDVVGFFAQAIIDNKDKIKEALTGALDFTDSVTGTLGQVIQDTFKHINKVYDEKVKPFIDSMSQGFSDLWGILLDGWNTYVQPVMDNIAKKFDEVMNGNVGSAIQHVIDLFGNVIDYLKVLWEETLKPIVDFLADILAPVFAGAFDIISTVVLNFIDVVAGIFDGIVQVFNGVIEFITGIFSGDLEKALGGLGKIWEGLVKIASTIWDSIYENSKEIWDKIWKHVGKIWEKIKDAVVDYIVKIKDKMVEKFNKLVDTAEDLWDDIKDAITDKCEEIWDGIVGWFEDIVGWFTGGWKDSEKETDKGWDNIEDAIDDGAEDAIKGLELKMSSVAPNISKVWGNVKSGVSTGWSNIKTTLTDWGTKAKDGVTGALGKVTSGASNIWNNVKSGASTAWSNIKTNVGTWASNVKTQATNSLNGVTGGVSTIWGNVKNGVSGAWDKVKGAVSSAATKVKDQVGSSLGGAKDKASTVWTNIKNGVSGGWNTVKSAVSTSATKTKDQVYNSLKGATTSVSNIWKSIKNGVSSAWNGIKTTVQSAVNNVKKCLNFSWSLPKPKIPKFSVSGGQAPWGFMGKGSLPSISIKWMAKGGIFTHPTLFGVGDAASGFGSNAEAVLPLDKLWQQLGKQFDNQNKVLSNGNNQPIVVNVQLDGKTIATTTVDNFKQMARLGNLDTSWL